jgi:ABC-type transport system involved in multi-copper enzyme maturation permease subunit
MAFYVVMARTVRELLGLKRTVALIAAGQTLVLFFSQVAWKKPFEAGNMSLEMQTSYLVGYFVVISFFWMAGICLVYLVVGTSGLDLVDDERKKGTLLLMVSKPISRSQLLLGKFLALVLTSVLLEGAILLGSVLVVWASLGLDPDTVSALLGVLPWIFLFSLLVVFMFAAVSMALSTVVTGAVVRNIVFTIVVMLVFTAGPVMRMAWPDVYEDYRLYYMDGSYNLGNAFMLALDQAETGRLTPESQAWLGITTGAYKAGPEELLTALVGAMGAFDPDIGAMPPSMERTTYVPLAGSFGIFLAITAAAIVVAGLALRKEEVY